MRDTAFVSLGSGWFSDVALGPNGEGRLIGGFDVPTGIEVRIMGWTGVDVSQPARPDLSRLVTLKTVEITFGTGYSRICFWQGVFWAAYHDGIVGHLWNLTTGQHLVLEPCQNNNPVCFGAGYVAWQGAAADSWPVSRMVLATGEVVSNLRQGQGTGLSRVLDDGRVVTVDEDRFALPGATQPCFAGDLAVGEGANGGALWQLGAKSGFVWPGRETFTPKCAIAADLVAVTTCGGRDGIRLFCGSRDELFTLTPPVDAPLVCTPLIQTVTVGDPARVSATGGTGHYAWSAPGGSPATGDGLTFATIYQAPGTYALTVTSGGEAVVCRVTALKKEIPVSLPDESALARSVFESFPVDIAALRAKCDETDALRAQFGEDDPRVQAGEVVVNNMKGQFTRRFAWACAQHDTGWGLLRKTSGALATRPKDGATHATDILMWKGDGSIVDVMSDRNVAWGVSGEKRAFDQWIAPLPEGHVDPPVDKTLAERVAALEAGLKALQEKPAVTLEDVKAALAPQFASIEARLRALE
jgi:hypothetical protein